MGVTGYNSGVRGEESERHGPNFRPHSLGGH